MCVAADRLDGSTNVLGGPLLDDFLVVECSLSSCVLSKKDVRVRRVGNVDDDTMQDLPSDDMVVEGVWKAEDIPQHPNNSHSDNDNIIIYRL